MWCYRVRQLQLAATQQTFGEKITCPEIKKSSTEFYEKVKYIKGIVCNKIKHESVTHQKGSYKNVGHTVGEKLN